MLEFSKLELSDKDIIEPYLAHDGEIMADRTFASLYIWRQRYDVKICIKNGILYFNGAEYDDKRTYYMPLSLRDGYIKEAFEEIEADAAEYGMDYQVVLVTSTVRAELEEIFEDKYVCFEDRDSFDYLYNASDLRELRGRKYQAKRNHINKFKSIYDGRWRYEAIGGDEHRRAIKDYTRKWSEARGVDGYQKDYELELQAIEQALDHMNELDIRGGIIWIDDQVAAYTLGAVTNNGKAMDVLFEKADTSYEGSYTAINNMFVVNACEGIEIINREEDLGIAGLRTAKLSYNPVKLTEKHIVMPKRGEA